MVAIEDHRPIAAHVCTESPKRIFEFVEPIENSQAHEENKAPIQSKQQVYSVT